MKSCGVIIHVNGFCKYILIVLIAFQHFTEQNLEILSKFDLG